MAKKAFQYKIQKPIQHQRPERDFQRAASGEELTGYVDGKKASDIEERWYRMTIMFIQQNRLLDYRFQPSYIAGRNMPGEVRVDYVWEIPPSLPIFLDGNFAHKSAEQIQRDKDQLDALNEHLSGIALPAVRIPGDLLKRMDDVIMIGNRVLAGETEFA